MIFIGWRMEKELDLIYYHAKTPRGVGCEIPKIMALEKSGERGARNERGKIFLFIHIWEEFVKELLYCHVAYIKFCKALTLGWSHRYNLCREFIIVPNMC